MLGMELFLESTKINNSKDDIEVEGLGESYSPDMEGMSEIMSANLQESLALESAVLLTANKHAKLLKEGKDVEAEQLQENVVKNFMSKVKALIVKMWQRVKDFFNSVKTYFQSLLQKESKFAETYGDEIKAISSIKIEGYKFNFKPSIKNLWKTYYTDSKVEETIKSLYDAIGNAKDKEAKAYVKGGDKDSINAKTDSTSASATKLSDKKYNRRTMAELFGRTPNAVEVTYTGAELYAILTKLNEKLNVVTQDQTDADSAYKEALDKIKAIESKLASMGEGTKGAAEVSKYVNSVGSLLKKSLEVVNTAAGIKAQCLKEEAAQAKKAAYKGIAEARKSGKTSKTGAAKKGGKKKVNESFDVTSLYEDLLG